MEEKQLTYWKAAGIGLLVGLCTIGLAFLGFVPLGNAELWGSVFAVFFSVLGIPVCILGAIIGKYRKNSPQVAWGGAIAGAISASIFVVYLMFNTCWGMC